ncbi:MAG: hypothetical protein OHK0046_19580 [Anaerolineae bacterium]
MTTLPFEDRRYALNDLINYPQMTLSAYSLTPLEKMLVGTFLSMARPTVVVELGIFKARTTAYICQYLEANQINAHVYGFDIPEQIDEVRQESAEMQRYEAEGRATLLPGYLPESLIAWLGSHNQMIDWALVDALHEFPNVTSELDLLWPRLSPNGVILCHDYDQRPEHEGVRYAVDRFADRTPDAHVCSLYVPPDPTINDEIESYRMSSTLVVLRRRPYDFSNAKLLGYLNTEAQWKFKRNRPTYEARTRAFLRSTGLLGVARSVKKIVRR